jgi:hypothetical protein
MPPATAEEQALCFQPRTTCWRTGELLSKMRPVGGMVRPKATRR